MKLPVSREFIEAAATAATSLFRTVLGSRRRGTSNVRRATAPREKQQRRDEGDGYDSDDVFVDAFDEDADLDPREGTGIDHLREGAAQQTHSSNVLEKQQHFREALPRLVSSACHATVDVGMLWNQQQALHVSQLQRHIDQWQPVHYACASASTSGSTSPATRVGSHTVLYMGTHVSGHVSVPECQCTACGARFPMPAPAAGCVERSHKRPHLWLDSRMCLLYHHLRVSGVAYDAWAAAVTNHLSQHAWAPSPGPCCPAQASSKDDLAAVAPSAPSDRGSGEQDGDGAAASGEWLLASTGGWLLTWS
jgi:hypothetical protein